MMKIAISTDENEVSAHFGRCAGYNFFEVEEGKIVAKSYAQNPGDESETLPKWLKGKGVDCIIAGGAGPKAQGFFTDLGIDFILGVQGKVDEVIKSYLNGTLKSGESTCGH